MFVIKTYFTLPQLIPFIPSVVFIILSIVLFHFNFKKTSVACLLIGGLGLRIFMALLDPYINLWDEQFHALVAKNMMENPIKPMLYKTALLRYDFHNWDSNHIWLHKQPLFLWQMALSMKLLGKNIFAIRLPSILLSTLTILFIYRAGKIAINDTTGFIAALFFATNHFILEQVSGYYRMEHNDVSFIFYVTASIWAWCEYQESNNKKWILLIGLFSGCAVLVKWLTGMLVYSGWGLVLVFFRENRNREKIRDFFFSILITLLVFVPWQIYISIVFPMESSWEYAYNTRHFFEVVEGYSGDVWYYFNNLKNLYGDFFIMPFFVCISSIFMWLRIKNLKYKTAFFTYIFGIYIFFTIAVTKTPSYTIIVCSMVFLAIASLFYTLLNSINSRIKNKFITGIIFTVILSAVAFLNLDIEKIENNHTYSEDQKTWRQERIHYTQLCRNVRKQMPSEDYVIFLSPVHVSQLIMFYTGNIAYERFPSKKEYQLLKKHHIKMAYYENKIPPDFLLNDNSIVSLGLY